MHHGAIYSDLRGERIATTADVYTNVLQILNAHIGNRRRGQKTTQFVTIQQARQTSRFPVTIIALIFDGIPMPFTSQSATTSRTLQSVESYDFENSSEFFES